MTTTGPAVVPGAFSEPIDRWASVRRALQTSGYADLVATFGPVRTSPQTWVAVREAAHDEARALLDLFLLGGRVKIADLPPSLQPELGSLSREGVCVQDGDDVHLGGLALYRHQGAWLFAQAQRPSPTMYVGDDSLALANRLETAARGKALDLCAGPGIQSLVAAGRGMDVVSVEINPVAASLAVVNSRLNALHNQMQVRIGDLWSCVKAGEQFDLITANPPLLPIPADVPYPFVGDGGPDGLDVTRRIIEPVADHLTSDGVVQVLGMTLSDGFFPQCLPWLHEFCASHAVDAIWTTTHHLSVREEDWWCRGVAVTAREHSPGEKGTDDLAALLADGYRELGATAVCDYFLRLRLGTGKVTYLDFSDPDQEQELWYR